MPDLKYKEIFRMVRIAVIFGAIYLIVSGVEDVCTYTEFYGRWPSIFFCLAVVVYLPLIFSPVLLGLSIFSRDADVSGWLIRRAGGTMWDRRFYYRTADVSDRYRRKPGKTRRNYRFVRRDVSVSDWSIRKSKRKRWNRRFLHAFVLVYAGSFWFAFQLAGLVAGC